VIRDFIVDGDRYEFDFKLCTVAKGYGQIDTEQDCWYYGCWASPERLQIVSYSEGDVMVTTCSNPAEFAQEIRKLVEWNREHGWEFKGIDPGMSESLSAWFVACGLGDLLH
jgi:hypothetical protein